MIFELTDSLISSILFSMENQTDVFFVSAESGTVVSRTETGIQESDEENFYLLPEWNSKDGYALLENFTCNLHAPMARESLRRVLAGGRGVFRNFKNAIKDFPEVERQWHFYKDRAMKSRIDEWYNVLRESWGLEKLELSSAGDTDELIQSDFIIRPFDLSVDEENVTYEKQRLEQQFINDLENGISREAVKILLKRQNDACGEKQGLVCCTQSEEFAGCVLYENVPDSLNRTALITDLFVCEDYRGMGIGTKLICECLENLRRNGIRWVLLFNVVMNPPLELLLSQNGFEKLGSGYAVNLLK